MLQIITNPYKGGNGLGKLVKARCDCGSVKEYRLRFIKSGHTVSCGCKLKIHGYTKHPLFKVWQSMKERCYNKNHTAYKDYGGRGINICQKWLKDVKTFIEWGITNGYKKGLEVDRIDNDKGYNESNCRFATPKQNGRNRRNTVKLIYRGHEKPLVEWAEIFNVPAYIIRQRMKRGYNITESFSKPIDKTKLKH